MHPPYLFTSGRLGFRPWLDRDIDALAAINADPEVMRFFPSVQTSAQTAAFVARMQHMFTEKGFCYFAVETLEDAAFAGFIGLAGQEYEAPFTPCVDIGWRLHPRIWGRGYATEGAARCLAYAFHTLKLDVVNAVAPAVNLPSVKVMEKIGMQYLLSFRHPALLEHERLVDCVCYEARNTGIS